MMNEKVKEKEGKNYRIKKVVQKGKKFQVYYNDEKNPIVLTEEQIVKFRIFKDNSFTEKEWKEINDSLDLSIVLDKAMKYIDYQMRTEKEVRVHLKEKGIETNVISDVVKELKKLGFLNDERYAEKYIENEITHLMGPKVIEYNLINKGIEEEVINKYLDKYPIELIADNALSVANKTLKTITGLPAQKQKETIYTKLMRMGYASNIINQVLRNIEYSEVDLDLLKTTYEKLLSKDLDKNKIIQKLLAKGYNYADIKKVIADFDFENVNE